LLARLEHAKAHNEVDKVLKLSRELKELEERIALAEGAHQNVWADINSRNRNRDRIEVHEAERRATEARRRALLENTKAAAAAAAAAAVSHPEGVNGTSATTTTAAATALSTKET